MPHKMKSNMRQRPSARLLVLDEQNRVLLFRFVFKDGALAGQDFWATPGGAVDPGETFEEAAKRELFEETGIEIDSIDKHIAEQEFVLPLPNGEHVLAHEKFFVVRTKNPALTNDHQTDEERQVMADHKWWHIADLRATSETFFPEDLADILMQTLM
jgi:8-oxo-dGTP diphosphatase